MKAITVQQPWAWAIVHGGKDIENRTRLGTWRPAVGQRVAIHAGRRWSERGGESDLIFAAMNTTRGATFDYGAVIGTVEVADVHPDAGCCEPWGEPSYVEASGTKRIDIVHLVLADPAACAPIPCRGALGLWTLPDDIAARLT